MISVISRATPKNLKGSLLRPQFPNIANPTSIPSSSTASRSLRATANSYRAHSSSPSTPHTRRTMASAPSTAPTSATTSTLPTPASSTHSITPPASVKSSNPSTVLATPSILVAATHRPLIDTAAIDAQMKLASLNHLAGYATTSYPDAVPQSSTTQYTPEEMARGYDVLREPFFNKGTSFAPEDRITKNLTGLIPHVMESMSTQVARAMKMINTRTTPIDKYLYLSTLKANNVDLFYRVLIDNVEQLMPLVYTPTIGDVCLQYSTLYTKPEALYISIKQRKSIRTILRNWPHPNPSICVVTDGSRILGLGDLGVNGVGIPIGKLALYTAAAGIPPSNTLPIVLDYGTSNTTFLSDPLYLGLRQPRVSPEEAQDFMDEFMEAVTEVYPNMVVQFEDFETEKAFNYLERYKHLKTFNDDIQGTGAVILAGYIGAVNLSNVPIEEQKLVFMGAGSAGVGVAKQLLEYYTKRGLTEDEAKDKFYLVDTKGLVAHDRGDKLPNHKKFFARHDNHGKQFKTLEEVIEYVKPTALVGLTATHGVFTERCIRALKESVDEGGKGRRPILFPLSNPLTKAECTFEQAVEWTEGQAIFASGSPFSKCVKNFGEEKTYYPNQGNNVYIFPGLGLGAILAKVSRVTDAMVYTSAAALAQCLNEEEIKMGLIYPKIARVRDASVVVAREVMKCARRDGVSDLPDNVWAQWEEWGDVALDQWIKERVYDPKFEHAASQHKL